MKRLIPIFAMAGVLLNVDAALGCVTEEDGYRRAMRSDLRRLRDAQGEYFRNNLRYAARLGELGTTFKLSPGVSAIVIGHVTAEGFSAIATSNGTLLVCSIFEGPRPPTIGTAGTAEGYPVCAGTSSSTRSDDNRIGEQVWMVLAALSVLSLLFLRGPRGSAVLAGGLVAITILYPIIFYTSCGFLLEGVAASALAGVGMFLWALRKKMAQA